METIGIVGSGTMGRGIACSFSLAGYPVILTDLTAELADKGRQAVLNMRDKLLAKRAVGNDTPLPPLLAGKDLRDLRDCSLIVEASLEELEVKREVFKQLEEVVSDACILVSNTSSISLTAIANGLRHPERTAGMHFFNPATVMQLVEVVQGEHSSDETLKAVSSWVERIGKTPVQSLDTPGFIVNRILAPMLNEAILLLESGAASREDIDRGMKLGANHPMGPLALADMVGLDVLLHVMESFCAEMGEAKYAPAALLRQMVEDGRLGVKTGEGFYSYHQ